MKIVAVIPARGGSKGIPLKNIFPLAGKPLIEYTIEAIIGSKVDCKVVVSTDSDKIEDVASKYDAVEVIKRPQEISGDTASTETTLLHAIDFLEQKYNESYDYVLTLQPTSPFRKSETIESFIKNFNDVKDNYDAQLTLTEDYTDFWIKGDGETFSRLYKNAPRRRQERKPLYYENSCIYITSVSSLKKTNSVLGEKTNGYIIDEIEGFDINEMVDIEFAEVYFSKTQGGF